jgi:hypothetical protein
MTFDGQLVATPISVRNGMVEAGKSEALFGGLSTGGRTYDVSVDGKKFLVGDQHSAAAQPLTLRQTWQAALRK